MDGLRSVTYDECVYSLELLMSVRVQVVLEEEERAAAAGAARAEECSLSAWMRASARDRLRNGHATVPSVQALEDLFARCSERDRGEEPAWSEHLRVMAASRSGVREVP